VVHGLRPTKPEGASSIGFSDFLWGFVQRCWGGDRNLRPKVSKVVTCLGKEATDWDGLMPPCTPAQNVASCSEGPLSDTLEHREFDILILPDVADRAMTQVIYSHRLQVAIQKVPQTPKLLGYSAARIPCPLGAAKCHTNDLRRSLPNLSGGHSLSLDSPGNRHRRSRTTILVREEASHNPRLRLPHSRDCHTTIFVEQGSTHAMSPEFLCSHDLRSRTTISTYRRCTHTSTSATSLPRPRFLRRNGKASDTSNRKSASSLVLSVER